MNPQHQAILDFIESQLQLSEEEKEEALKLVKEADKALTISEFKLERTEKVKRTTAILLEETIDELEQKRKSIEEANQALNDSI
ncbi:MAG: two-component sensor histidine kinase, partial [Salegentibacter sp.]